MSLKQQELDQRIDTLKEWLSEYQINEIKFPTVRPGVKPPAPRAPTEVPSSSKPGAAGAEELVLGPGGKYYPRGEIPSEADILARQAAVDRAAAEQAKRAGKAEPAKSAAEIPPGIRITGGEPVHPLAFEPAAPKPQVSTGLKDPNTGKDIMRDMTPAEIRAKEAEAIKAAKDTRPEAGAANDVTDGKKGGLWAWAKANPVKAASLGLGAAALTSPVTAPMLAGLAGANLQAAWDKITSGAETAAQTVAPLLPQQYQIQPGEQPPARQSEPVGRPDYKPPAPSGTAPPPPPVREAAEDSFSRLRELAGIAKNST